MTQRCHRECSVECCRAGRRGGMAGHSIWLLAVPHCIVLHLHLHYYATILIRTCSRPTVRFWWARPKQPCQLTTRVFQRVVHPLVFCGKVNDALSTDMKTQYTLDITKSCNEGLCVCVAPAVTRLIQQIVAPHNPAVSYILWD